MSFVRNGVLKIDGALEGEIQSAGQTEYIEVERTFFLGNVLKDTLEINVVRSNLQVIHYLSGEILLMKGINSIYLIKISF